MTVMLFAADVVWYARNWRRWLGVQCDIS